MSDRVDRATADVSARRRRILDEVRQRSELEVTALAEILDTTVATLRRDLRLLEAQNLVRRSYGRIAATETSRFETPLSWRMSSDNPERDAIAQAAVRQLGDASSVYIDEGATTAMVARLLPADRPLTVITPSIPAASELAGSSPHEVLLLGGRVRGRTLGAVDFWARDMLAGFSIDLAFIGANGVTVDEGLTTPDPAVAAVKAMAVRVSRRRIFVGDHTKFGVTSFARFARIDEMELLVTGERLSLSVERRMREAGARVLRV